MNNKILQRALKWTNSKYFPVFLLIFIIFSIYYRFFLFGKIPFPGDLLIGSYSPWFDYHKLPIQNPLISDVFSQFFLWKYLTIDIIKTFNWPLWNPYSFLGTPLLATYHSATLYPLNLLLLYPNYLGWGLFIFSQTLIAALTMYLFTLTLTKNKISSVMAGILFGLGGLMTTWLELGTAVHAMAWLPLGFYSIERYYTEKKSRFLLILTLSVALLTLAGNVQVTTYSFFILTIYTLIKFGQKNLFRIIRQVLPIFFALVISIGIVAPQILPSFDILKKSIRVNDSYSQQNNYGLVPAGDLLKFFIADFYGSPVTRNYWGFLNYSETSGFIGSLSLVFILYSVFYLKKDKTIIFFLGTFFLSILLAVDNPISRFFYNLKLPLLTASYASRIMFLSVFSAVVLIAFAINQILVKKDVYKLFKCLLWSFAVFIGISLGTIIAIFIMKTFFNDHPLTFIKNIYLTDSPVFITNYLVGLKNSLLPLMMTFMGLFLMSVFFLKPIKNKFSIYKTQIIVLFLLIILIADLSRYFLKFNTFSDTETVYPKTPVLNYLTVQPGLFRVGREHAEVFPPNTWIAYKLSSFEGYDPIYLDSYSQFIHFLNGGDLRDGHTGRYAELASNYSSPYLDLINVKYFIGILRDKNGIIPGDLINYKLQEAGLKPVFKDRSSIILENPNSMDRFFFAKSFQIADRKKAAEIIMTDKGFNPKQNAILEKDLQLNSITGEGEVNLKLYTPNKVILNTKTGSEQLLILSDQYEDGWKAKIDGQDTPISPADLVLRGIKIPSGSHEIVFYYLPDSFLLGLKISLISFVFVILYLLFAYYKKII